MCSRVSSQGEWQSKRHLLAKEGPRFMVNQHKGARMPSKSLESYEFLVKERIMNIFKSCIESHIHSQSSIIFLVFFFLPFFFSFLFFFLSFSGLELISFIWKESLYLSQISLLGMGDTLATLYIDHMFMYALQFSTTDSMFPSSN